MKSDLTNIQWGGFCAAPNRERFLIWYKEQLEIGSKRHIFLLWDEQNAVGYCSLIMINSDVVEISYGVISKYSGKEYGFNIIKQAESLCDARMIIAWVAEDNISSIKCFIKNQYQKTSEAEMRDLPLLGGPHKFNKWIKQL